MTQVFGSSECSAWFVIPQKLPTSALAMRAHCPRGRRRVAGRRVAGHQQLGSRSKSRTLHASVSLSNAPQSQPRKMRLLPGARRPLTECWRANLTAPPRHSNGWPNRRWLTPFVSFRASGLPCPFPLHAPTRSIAFAPADAAHPDR